jgi:hypothetical protein
MTVELVAWILGFQRHDIPVLAAKGLLRPLGGTGGNTVKYFARTTVLEHAEDPVWLDKATRSLQAAWRERNANKRPLDTPSRNGGAA